MYMCYMDMRTRACTHAHTHTPLHIQVPRDRLLVMDIPGGDGWEKLIPFLNSFLPQRVEMPSANLTFPSRH